MVNGDRKLVIKSEFERLVFAEVYAPLHADTYVDAMTAEEIKKAAYAFMRKQRNSRIDVMHNELESGSYVVESFLAQKNDPNGFVEGAWVLGVKVEDDVLWDKIIKGELNGFSLSGTASVRPKKVPMERVKMIEGDTERSIAGLLPDHAHSFRLEFDDDLRVIPTHTSTILGHRHKIVQATATETELDHAHRFILME